MKKLLILTLLFIPSTVFALNITVPSATTNGYDLTSTTTGAYIATTTSPRYIGWIYSSSTNSTSSLPHLTSTQFSISGQATGCAQFGAGGFITSSGTACGVGSFGQSWEVANNIFSQSSLAPTTTKNIAVNGVGTSTFVGGLEAWRQIAAPYFQATSTTATSTFTNVNITTNLQLPFTAGSVPYTGTGGTIVQNNAKLCWDNANGRLSVGTTDFGACSPQTLLHLGYDVNGDSIDRRERSSDTRYALLGFYTSGIESWSVGIRSTGDGFADDLLFRDNSGNINVAIGKTARPSYFRNFLGIASTTPWGQLSVHSNGIGAFPEFVVGSSTKTDFIVNNNGRVGVGTTSPFTKFAVNGASAGDYFIGTANSTSTLNGQISVNNGNAYPILLSGLENSPVSYGGLWLGTNLANASTYAFLGTAGQTFFNAADTGTADMEFRIGNATKFTVGNSGAGVYLTPNTAPTRPFQVNGSSAGTQAFSVEANGRVGIGATTTPFAQLSIQTTAGTSSLIIGSSTGTHFIVDKNGNVGINTAAPTTKFELDNGVAFISGENSGLVVDAGGNSRMGLMKFSGYYPAFAYTSANAASFGSYNQTSLLTTGGTYTEQMTLSSAGLTVFDDIYVQADDSAFTFDGSSASRIGFAKKSGQAPMLAYANSQSFQIAEYTTTSALQGAISGNSPTVRMTINNGGNIGVASGTPWGLLSVHPSGIGDSPEFVVGSSTKTDFIVTNSGVVGVGTSSPGLASSLTKLAVQGGIETSSSIRINSVTGSSQFYGPNGSASGPTYSWQNAASSGMYVSGANGNVRFSVSGFQNILSLNNTGATGISTTTPFATFAINPTGGTASNQFVVGSSTATNFKIDNSGAIFAPNTASSGSTQTGYWCYDANGQFIRDTVACLVSAEKFKKDITNLDVGIDELMKLRPVNYYLKDSMGDYNNTVQQLGFIADEAMKVDSRLITFDKNGDVHGFRYEQFTALITKAVQDTWNSLQHLTAKVTGLENRLNDQERRIKLLEDKINKLDNGKR